MIKIRAKICTNLITSKSIDSISRSVLKYYISQTIISAFHIFYHRQYIIHVATILQYAFNIGEGFI